MATSLPAIIDRSRRETSARIKPARRAPASCSGAASIPPGSVDAARSAGLRYVRDLEPGLRRVRRGHGFACFTLEGRPLRDRAELARIRALAIPPAWTEVWICTTDRGHIQATGRDARGRKQYRYHERWREVRDETKFGQLVEFGRALPALRRRLARDMARPGLPREKVLATVVRLLETTMVRVGNEEYARANQSFGLTTLRDRHVKVSGAKLVFRFRGKSGKNHTVRVVDRRLARIVRACQDIPGYELFQYFGEHGAPQSIDSADVNAYLRDLTGADITAKLFRTWAGTVQAVRSLRVEPADAMADRKRILVEAIREVARCLANTPAISRRCYIHPAVIEAYEQGVLSATLMALETRPIRCKGLAADERATLAFLERAARGRTRH